MHAKDEDVKISVERSKGDDDHEHDYAGDVRIEF